MVNMCSLSRYLVFLTEKLPSLPLDFLNHNYILVSPYYPPTIKQEVRFDAGKHFQYKEVVKYPIWILF